MVIEEVLLAFQVETLDRTIPSPYAFQQLTFCTGTLG